MYEKYFNKLREECLIRNSPPGLQIPISTTYVTL